jgi:MFS family permease
MYMQTKQQQNLPANRKAAIGLWAVFITQFVSFLFINARNIAQPGIIHELDGMSLFSWLIALPALSGAASTLLFGKLSDIYGRRAILLLSIGIFLLGLGISTKATTMAFLVAAATFMSIGHFPIIPLCFTAIGDLFPPAERAKWTGLLSLPSGMAALIGPVLGGVVAESAVGWRGLYWGTIPLMLIAGGLLVVGLPKIAQTVKPKMDVLGTVVMVVATTTLFIGFSWLGTPDKLRMGAILLMVSLAAWTGFIRIEQRAEAPILDPHIFVNRTFMTAAGAAFLSYFGMLGIVAYSPIFVQTVMKIDPTTSGSMLTPYTTIVAFLGIPVGLLLARTRKYKWMYIIGYAIGAVALFTMWQFTAVMPGWWYVLVTSLAAFGIGSIGTITTLVAQFAMPKRLLGVAVGAIFFFQMIGLVVAPSVLRLVQSNASDLESGLKMVFLIGAVAMTIALFMILTIPEISMDSGVSEKSESSMPTISVETSIS